MLEEAENPRHPLLERLRFLSISASNLDEFYSVRVAALIGQAKAGGTLTSADGRTAAQQLAEIKQRAELLLADQQRILRELLALLREAGVELCGTGPPDRGRQGLARRLVHGAGVSGGDAAGGRSGASVPVHLQLGSGAGAASGARG